MIRTYENLSLGKVINASGKMTILGVSKVSESVLDAQRYGGTHFFVMEELEKATGKYISDLLGVADAQIVSSASAGMALSVAGLIGEGSTYHLYHPYASKIRKREIIIPKGHNVDYGTAIEVMIQQGGGVVVEAGYANMCDQKHIEDMITEDTAAILYIKSHHTVQKSMLSVEEAVEVAKRNNVPLIVDAAAEEDLRKYCQMGIDLVIFSGAKAIEGPSSGLVVGNEEYIRWVRMQNKGLGRSMKVGKDNMLGFTQAIHDFLENGSEDGESMKARLQPLINEINTIKGLKASIVQDDAGRDIYRASVQVFKHKTAKEVIAKLKEGQYKVYTREYKANNGIIEFDIRSVNEKEMRVIAQRLREIMEEK